MTKLEIECTVEQQCSLALTVLAACGADMPISNGAGLTILQNQSNTRAPHDTPLISKYWFNIFPVATVAVFLLTASSCTSARVCVCVCGAI